VCKVPGSLPGMEGQNSPLLWLLEGEEVFLGGCKRTGCSRPREGKKWAQVPSDVLVPQPALPTGCSAVFPKPQAASETRNR
jgi:hypothetical protein